MVCLLLSLRWIRVLVRLSKVKNHTDIGDIKAIPSWLSQQANRFKQWQALWVSLMGIPLQKYGICHLG
jgi:hypothetical protein